ncbi:MAG: hypothetical protein K8R87_11395 [Verrucomicrobia bacterium]|nr:hypothetical protein [Verrucomicrobiota bacterium]
MNTRPRRKNGYTIAEVLMAAGLLGIMIGGAVRLLGTMNIVESASKNVTVGLNILENAATLWQLGLTPDEVLSVLPTTTNNDTLNLCVIADSSGNTVTFGTAGTTTLANSMGTLENITISVNVEDPQGTNNRTQTVTVYRPSSR